MQGLCLGRKTPAQFLYGPGFLATCGLPQQPGRFLCAAFRDEHFVKRFLELGALFRLAGGVARLTWLPLRCFVAGDARLKSHVSLRHGNSSAPNRLLLLQDLLPRAGARERSLLTRPMNASVFEAGDTIDSTY